MAVKAVRAVRVARVTRVCRGAELSWVLSMKLWKHGSLHRSMNFNEVPRVCSFIRVSFFLLDERVGVGDLPVGVVVIIQLFCHSTASTHIDTLRYASV